MRHLPQDAQDPSGDLSWRRSGGPLRLTLLK
jgi:hypothetical protein